MAPSFIITDRNNMAKIFFWMSLGAILLRVNLWQKPVVAGGRPALSGGSWYERASSGEFESSIPPSYLPLEKVYEEIAQLAKRYPALVHVEEIGTTATYRLPILAVKVSDNAVEREDEPRALFTGVHHAREPVGANICLEIIKTLCDGYGKKPQITESVNSAEVWFVPIVNPDGYKYMFDANLEFPWWRKNTHDNDGDGAFNPLFDGVDLNRNYDYNWSEGGDDNPGSWFYRGSAAFSEKETRAVKKLAARENFAVGISYHSYGESVLFPWANYTPPPDLNLIVEIAQKLASRLKRDSGLGTYSILPLDGRIGQSSVWMYATFGTIDYIVEVGTQYFPAPQNVPAILEEHVQGALFLISRLFDTGVRGHVFDRNSGQPLVAVVEVREFSAAHVNPRKTDPIFGGFTRLLTGGVYNIEIRSNGYRSRFIPNVKVVDGEFTELRVGLEVSTESTYGH